MPSKFTFTGNNTIEILYDAVGQKLRKVVKTNGVETSRQDYLGGIELKNNRLESIYNEEGRAYNTSNATQVYPYTWRYEYNLKDHLGNTRLVFTDKNNNGKIDDQTEVLQETHYYPFGMTFNGSWYTDNTASKYKYQYNGKELNEDFGLNMSDYGARWYDASIGRWWGIDPLAEKYYRWNPFSYCYSNPIKFLDPNGKEVDFSRIQEYDKKNKTDFANKIMSELSSQTGLMFSVNDRGKLDYKKNDKGEAIVSTKIDKDGKTVEQGSKTARDFMKSSIDNKEVNVMALVGDNKKSYASKTGDQEFVKLSISQIKMFEDGAVNVDSKTLGFGMTLMHELHHTKLGGSLVDDKEEFGNIGGVETQMNIIRNELNAQGENYGQRLSYTGMYIEYRHTFNTYVPFNSNSLLLLKNGETPTGIKWEQFIKY